MTQKITKIDLFNAIIGELENYGSSQQLIDFIQKEIELTKKKNSYKKTKKSKSDTDLINLVLTYLEEHPLATCTEITKGLNYVYSPQKVSAYLKKLIDSEQIKRTISKRISYFEVVNND